MENIRKTPALIRLTATLAQHSTSHNGRRCQVPMRSYKQEIKAISLSSCHCSSDTGLQRFTGSFSSASRNHLLIIHEVVRLLTVIENNTFFFSLSFFGNIYFIFVAFVCHRSASYDSLVGGSQSIKNPKYNQNLIKQSIKNRIETIHSEKQSVSTKEWSSTDGSIYQKKPSPGDAMGPTELSEGRSSKTSGP